MKVQIKENVQAKAKYEIYLSRSTYFNILEDFRNGVPEERRYARQQYVSNDTDAPHVMLEARLQSIGRFRTSKLHIRVVHIVIELLVFLLAEVHRHAKVGYFYARVEHQQVFQLQTIN